MRECRYISWKGQAWRSARWMLSRQVRRRSVQAAQPRMQTPTSVGEQPSAKVIDGKRIAKTVREEVAVEVRELKEKHGVTPGLAVIMVGTRSDSMRYVENKRKACKEVGIHSYLLPLQELFPQDRLLELIEDLNRQPQIHGILVQLPLPERLDTGRILESIRVEKDVDGFHPMNMGRFCLRNPTRPPLSISCTPLGCLELLDRHQVPLSGKRAVVLGRSNVVGLPMAMLLMARDATVTICHSKTEQLAERVREADIVVAAMGQPELVKGDWIKPGAVVIDVGMNTVMDRDARHGVRLAGDVEYAAAKERASLITPVPGGVGPMTVAMLLRNTVRATRRAVEGGEKSPS
ncbi:hypothetical protein CDCA_CDCA09G2669 [Cyanidium caldarium]|uniref:Methenyltetrahydrofolate cyclohydrolase n=1 Tax=Cyanidium caldarium TaxID=2771 RepID=A0AAV9IX00_CYACA|nr:hypothetical protein CDCA_CDCA09G2669 [Cyanidium caldarium]